MKGWKRIYSKIDHHSFKRYLFFSILLIVVLSSLGTIKFTQARYESVTSGNVKPTLAFFLVDVTTQSGLIKLEGLVPSEKPYTFTFDVSNFNDKKRASVDLTYSIEIITTTNIPLEFKIFKGNNMTENRIDSDTVLADDNGVYYRHLVINEVSSMDYDQNCTDLYTLWVMYPTTYMDYPEKYAGIIDLVDIKINAEQVV